MYNAQEIVAAMNELNLPTGSYVLVGGGSLAMRGIRPTHDLDIVVLPDLFALLKQTWPVDNEYVQKWARERLKRGDVEIYPDLYLEKADEWCDVADLIARAEIVEGIPLQSLDHLKRCKLDSARDKDLRDVELIETYLKRYVT